MEVVFQLIECSHMGLDEDYNIARNSYSGMYRFHCQLIWIIAATKFAGWKGRNKRSCVKTCSAMGLESQGIVVCRQRFA